MLCFILLLLKQSRNEIMLKYNISAHAAIALQDLARLLQHLFYYVSLQTSTRVQ